jgi:hypothetical protein
VLLGAHGWCERQQLRHSRRHRLHRRRRGWLRLAWRPPGASLRHQRSAPPPRRGVARWRMDHARQASPGAVAPRPADDPPARCTVARWGSGAPAVHAADRLVGARAGPASSGGPRAARPAPRQGGQARGAARRRAARPASRRRSGRRGDGGRARAASGESAKALPVGERMGLNGLLTGPWGRAGAGQPPACQSWKQKCECLAPPVVRCEIRVRSGVSSGSMPVRLPMRCCCLGCRCRWGCEVAAARMVRFPLSLAVRVLACPWDVPRPGARARRAGPGRRRGRGPWGVNAKPGGGTAGPGPVGLVEAAGGQRGGALERRVGAGRLRVELGGGLVRRANRRADAPCGRAPGVGRAGDRHAGPWRPGSLPAPPVAHRARGQARHPRPVGWQPAGPHRRLAGRGVARGAGADRLPRAAPQRGGAGAGRAAGRSWAVGLPGGAGRVGPCVGDHGIRLWRTSRDGNDPERGGRSSICSASRSCWQHREPAAAPSPSRSRDVHQSPLGWSI